MKNSEFRINGELPMTKGTAGPGLDAGYLIPSVSSGLRDSSFRIDSSFGILHSELSNA